MLFNSVLFIFFFPTVVILNFILPRRYRWIWLLAASYYFYWCWRPEYIVLIIASTLLDYYDGIQMGKTDNKSKRRKYLLMSLVGNLGLLFSFKYFNFFNESAHHIFTHFGMSYSVPALNVILPVGISFYTFQTLSYSIDVYQGKKEPERHLGIFSLYVAFFPQLVAGPIERSTRLLPQLRTWPRFDYYRMLDGLRLMLWGFFQKMVIADRLAIYVDNVYGNAHHSSGLALITATYFFAFQIFCDFAGYSNIAIGASRILGYDLMINFRRPYFSKSISEFWKRWHISLSSWFKDYLYIPLGGNRVAVWRWLSNLMIVFLVSGLWHGANWTFVVWGGLHGTYLLTSIVTKALRKRVADFFRLSSWPARQKTISVFITFHLALFAWIFFRAPSVSEAFAIIRRMATAINFSRPGIIKGISVFEFVLSIISLLFLFSVQYFQERSGSGDILSEKPLWIKWLSYFVIIFWLLLFGVFEANQFIYFQF